MRRDSLAPGVRGSPMNVPVGALQFVSPFPWELLYENNCGQSSPDIH